MTALVETKLFLPRSRAGLVLRPRLAGLLGSRPRPAHAGLRAGRLREDHAARLLARTATRRPGGSRGCRSTRPTATPDRFWTYVLTALDRAAPGTASAGLSLLARGPADRGRCSRPCSTSSASCPTTSTWCWTTTTSPRARRSSRAMAFLLDRLPPQVRLVISTRADPALPLARLRARGELTEVRAADLRFTADETAAFLADATGLDLAAGRRRRARRPDRGLDRLPAARRPLAARPRRPGRVHRRVHRRRPLRRRLPGRGGAGPRARRDPPRSCSDTSILDRLTGPLCDAVTGDDRLGARMLETLERRNLFVVPLDDQRRWYRYHHLFADVLRAHLLAERPDDAPELHRRASRWYAAAGETEDAVRHALAGGDVDAAAELVELAIPELRRDRREHVIRAGSTSCPTRSSSHRPVLAAGLIGALMASNEFDDVPPRLHALERLLAGPPSALVVVDRAELARVPGAAGDLAGRAGPDRRRPGGGHRPRRAGRGRRRRGGRPHHRGRQRRWPDSGRGPPATSPPPTAPTRRPSQGLDAGRAHRRRARLLARRRRHGARPRPARRRRAHPRARSRARRAAPAGRVRGHARNRGHARRAEPRGLAPQRPRPRPPSSSGGPTTWASPPGSRRTRTAGGWRWRGCGSRTATTSARSSSSTRPSASTWATTHRRSTPSTPPAPACWPASGDVGGGRRLGSRAPGRARRRARPTSASTSTSPWPGCCWASTAPTPRPPSLEHALGLLDRLLAAAEAGSRFGTVLEVEVLRTLALRRAGRARSGAGRRRPRARPRRARRLGPLLRRRGTGDGRGAHRSWHPTCRAPTSWTT